MRDAVLPDLNVNEVTYSDLKLFHALRPTSEQWRKL